MGPRCCRVRLLRLANSTWGRTWLDVGITTVRNDRLKPQLPVVRGQDRRSEHEIDVVRHTVRSDMSHGSRQSSLVVAMSSRTSLGVGGPWTLDDSMSVVRDACTGTRGSQHWVGFSMLISVWCYCVCPPRALVRSDTANTWCCWRVWPCSPPAGGAHGHRGARAVAVAAVVRRQHCQRTPGQAHAHKLPRSQGAPWPVCVCGGGGPEGRGIVVHLHTTHNINAAPTWMDPKVTGHLCNRTPALTSGGSVSWLQLSRPVEHTLVVIAFGPPPTGANP